MPNWYDLGWKTENGNQQTSSTDDPYQLGTASGVANQNNVISNIASFENGTKIKIKIKYNDIPGATTINGNIPYTRREYLVDVFVVDGNGTEYPCSTNYALGTCASSVSLPSYQSANFKPFDFYSWGDYNANSLRLNNEYNESMGAVTTIYPSFNIGGHGTSAPYFMRVNGDSDIELIAYGEMCYDTGGFEVIPTKTIGKIPKSILDNPNIFDPKAGLNAEDIIKIGGGSGGRKPTRNYTGDDVDFPTLPTGANALAFGHLNVFLPSAPQLNGAMDILWTDPEETIVEGLWEGMCKWLFKPQQYLVSLMLTPINPTTSTSKNIKYGKYDSGISAPTVADQWHIVDCGQLSIPLMYGSYLDYDYTQCAIYLPYIGVRPLNVKEVMGGTLHIKYYVDILTGSAICFIKVSNIGSNNSVLHTYECNVQMQVPITSNDYSQTVTSLMHASMSAVGGASFPTGQISKGTVGQVASDVIDATRDIMSGGQILQTGNLNSNTGLLAEEKPYIILDFPVSLEDSNYTRINGKSSASCGTLSQFSGYTVCKEVHLDNIDLPDSIKREIESQLKSGIIL